MFVECSTQSPTGFFFGTVLGATLVSFWMIAPVSLAFSLGVYSVDGNFSNVFRAQTTPEP